MKKRRRFTAKFNAMVALKATREEQTILELAAKRQLHLNQNTW
jgi:hypothetical protein